MTVRRLLFVVLLVGFPLTSLAQNVPPAGHTVDGLEHPESVARGPDGASFYAANIGKKLAPTAKDGDGFIARLSADGSVDTRRYLPAPSSDAVLHAPKGTVVTNGRVVTADIDRVVGFDLDDRSKVVDVSLQEKGVSFLNDVAVWETGTVFVSASDQGTIYRVDLEAGTATALDVDVPGANGLAVSDGTLYAVTFGGDQGGKLWTLSLSEDGRVSDVSSCTIVDGGRFDGVVVRSDGQILVSDWGVEGGSDPTAAVHAIGEWGTGAVTTLGLPDWQGPADFDCATERGCWIPDLPASTVRIIYPGDRLAK